MVLPWLPGQINAGEVSQAWVKRLMRHRIDMRIAAATLFMAACEARLAVKT